MTKFFSFLFVALVSTQALAESYVGASVGRTGGGDWEPSTSPEFSFGYHFNEQFTLEITRIDVGESKQFRDDVTGVDTTFGFKKKTSELITFTAAAGVFVYNIDQTSGDTGSSTIKASPSLSVSGDYAITENVALRVQARKLFIDAASGEPSRLSFGVIYNF